ncbi:prefoldin subunit superfamily protein [Cardiosporidium cionae]|uniref:Prefoldin subunit superfamily protein n=1 Tax=Cardiosporidium cionae TaxID=476202 RepID=A0ABQ7JBE3_9APIC|nr:prefoldin subunit superfamily protein [Cardiosporidium cionae]|eukprot:KAF8821265.1 prefoldin subunit superfamily protein [Cardiosporidium cionae]
MCKRVATYSSPLRTPNICSKSTDLLIHLVTTLFCSFISSTQIPQFPKMEEFVDNSKETPRKIPACKFIENVELFVGDRDPVLLEDLARELLMKYNYMKRSLQVQLSAPKGKLPDIKDALQIIRYLKNKDEDFETQFNLADILYSKALIPSTKIACLWLGANTMLEYTLNEAEEVLVKNSKIAEDTIKSTTDDLEWLQTQITTAEVNVARIHNFAIRQRHQQKQKIAALEKASQAT